MHGLFILIFWAVMGIGDTLDPFLEELLNKIVIEIIHL